MNIFIQMTLNKHVATLRKLRNYIKKIKNIINVNILMDKQRSS